MYVERVMTWRGGFLYKVVRKKLMRNGADYKIWYFFYSTRTTRTIFMFGNRNHNQVSRIVAKGGGRCTRQRSLQNTNLKFELGLQKQKKAVEERKDGDRRVSFKEVDGVTIRWMSKALVEEDGDFVQQMKISSGNTFNLEQVGKSRPANKGEQDFNDFVERKLFRLLASRVGTWSSIDIGTPDSLKEASSFFNSSVAAK